MEELKRSPAKEKKICEIREGGRIRILCTVINGAGNEITVDDGTGQIKVVFDDPELVKKALEYKKIRVFGKPFAGMIKGEIVQDMRKVDVNLYKKVYNL